MSIELSHDELLVLYDLLHRLEDVEEIFEKIRRNKRSSGTFKHSLKRNWLSRSRRTTRPSSRKPAVL